MQAVTDAAHGPYVARRDDGLYLGSEVWAAIVLIAAHRREIRAGFVMTDDASRAARFDSATDAVVTAHECYPRESHRWRFEAAA